MKRRSLLQGLPALLAADALRGFAQPRERPARVAWISHGFMASQVDAFRQGIADRGHVPGRDIVIEERRARPDGSDLDEISEALVRERVDVVVATGAAAGKVNAALNGRRPLVFGFSGDPVEAGLVKSLARPGVNATGVSMLALDLVGKRIELLREAVPHLKRVAVLANPAHPGQQAELREASRAAQRLGVEVLYLQVRTAPEFEDAFRRIKRDGSQAIDLFPDGTVIEQRDAIAEFSLRERIPAISGWAIFARAGNLFAYGPNLAEVFGQVAGQVDRIVKGTPAADLPVELPKKVELVVNAKAAKALGLALPRALLLRADEVIS